MTKTILAVWFALFLSGTALAGERQYTVKEIDDLRHAVENKYIWGSYNGPYLRSGTSQVWGRSYREDEKTKAVEEQVRTLMLGGITAEDLYASEPQ